MFKTKFELVQVTHQRGETAQNILADEEANQGGYLKIILSNLLTLSFNYI